MNELAICSGVAMLSEGVRAGCEFLGLEHRVVCHVEREIPAAAQLVTLMETGIIDPAPIWSDLLTFKGKQWRKRVDCITGGFPCQPWSAAGKQEGTADERWIWPDIVRIIRETEPTLCFFENVRGLISGGGLEFVLADLADLGFDAEWCVVSAADVGADHQRERVFILACRAGIRWRERRPEPARQQGRHDASERGCAVDDTQSIRIGPGGLSIGTESPQSSPASPGGNMGDTDNSKWRPEGQIGETQQRAAAEWPGGTVFAPGPLSDRWPGIIADHPYLRPATEPGVRMLVDGVAYVVDESRTDQLRAIGNGVVPLAAAVAFVELVRRADIV